MTKKSFSNNLKLEFLPTEALTSGVIGKAKPLLVKRHLEHILASPCFQNSPQLSKFLRFIVEAVLVGKQNRLKQYTIAIKALGRPKDFNPAADPIIRVEARRLRRTLLQYYQEQGNSDLVRIEIPKGTYVPIIRTNSPSLIPVASKLTASLSKTSLPSTAQDNRLSILVLPLTFLGEAENSTYIANGLLEQLIERLTQFQEVRVIGPLLPDKLALTSYDWSELGNQYQSQFILHGSSCSQSPQMRITFKLVEVTTSEIVWAETYDHHDSTRAIFEFQDRVASQIAATIADSFGIIPRIRLRRNWQNPPQQFSVYDAVLRYHHHFTILTPESRVAAYGALEKAVKLDPNYALIHAMLADLYGEEYHLIGKGEEKLERQEELVQRALLLDPYCQLAHLMKANIHFFRKQRYLFIQEVEQTLKLNPYHATTLFSCGMFLAFVGEWSWGLALVEEAMSLNPHYPGWYHIPYCLNYYRQGAFQEACAEAFLCNTPGLFLDPLLRAAVLGQMGHTEAASAALEEMSSLLPVVNLRELLSRTFFSEDNVTMLLYGLTQAGLSVLG